MKSYNALEYFKVIAKATIHARWFYKNPWRSSEDIKKYQESQIKKLLTHAYQTTDLYHKKYKSAGIHPDDFNCLEDLKKFPTVTKDEIIEHFPEGVISKSVDTSKCIHSVSSGSSGKVITILHEPKDTWAYALGRFRILNLFKNYRPWDKSLYIYTSPYPAMSYFGLYQSYFISTLNDLKDTAKIIKETKPKFISSYPSRMLELTHYFSPQEARDLKLKLISLGSELSTRSQRDLLADHFDCPVYDEYSSEELGWIAGECPDRNYHLWEDISHIEVLKSDNQSSEGEIVGTNLHNFAMPFIRYRQGDIGVIEENRCPCGRQSRMMTSFLGRNNDMFKFANGKTASPAYLLDVVYDLLLKLKSDIADFCLIQESSTKVRLQIVKGKSFLDDNLPQIKKRLEELLPVEAIIECVNSENLYKTKTGKRNPIISTLT